MGAEASYGRDNNGVNREDVVLLGWKGEMGKAIIKKKAIKETHANTRLYFSLSARLTSSMRGQQGSAIFLEQCIRINFVFRLSIYASFNLVT